MADRDTQRRLRAALEAFETEPGVIYAVDQTGPAVYRLEPSWLTALLCLGCGFVTLRLGLPRLLRQTLACGTCGAPIGIEPPFEVLAARLPAGQVS